MTRGDTTLDVVLAPSGERLALIRDGVERDYVWLGGNLVAYFDGPTGEAVHVITDHIGFPLMAVDSGGTTVWDPLHEPYGELVGEFSAAADPGLRYPGQWQDELEVDGSCVSGDCTMPGPLDGSVSLFENGYRWYRTAWGRYTQSDPAGLSDGTNLFLYANASPVVMIDPEGLEWIAPARGPDDRRDEVRTCVVLAFLGNYMDMREANTIGADHYFHCKANCEATRCGLGGADYACVISNAREAFDRWKGDPPSASADDQRANEAGREGAKKHPHYLCRTICATFRPSALSNEY